MDIEIMLEEARPRILRVGLIAFGASGRIFHAPFIMPHPLFELAAVFERGEKTNGADFAARHGYPTHVDTVRSAEALCARSDIDLIVVCSPVDYHFEHAKLALLSGKHVLVEKPFCTNAAHARELVMTAASHKLVCVPYQNRRFDSDFRTLSKLIREGQLGDIVEYNGYFNRWSPSVRSVWKDTVAGAGGNFLSLGSHMIDQAVAIFGAPGKIWADIRCQRSGGILDDAFEVHLFYDHFHLSSDGHIHTSAPHTVAGEHAAADKNSSDEFGGVHKGGFRAILKGSLLCRDHRVRYMVHGTRGSWTKRGVDVQEAYMGSGERLATYLTPAVIEGKVPVPESHPTEPREIWGELTSLDGAVTTTEPEIGSYQMVYDSLYESIVHQKPSFVAGNTAITVVKLLELAYESSRTGQVLSFSE